MRFATERLNSLVNAEGQTRSLDPSEVAAVRFVLDVDGTMYSTADRDGDGIADAQPARGGWIYAIRQLPSCIRQAPFQSGFGSALSGRLEVRLITGERWVPGPDFAFPNLGLGPFSVGPPIPEGSVVARPCYTGCCGNG